MILTSSGAHRKGSSKASELYKARLRLDAEVFLSSGSGSGRMFALLAILQTGKISVVNKLFFALTTDKGEIYMITQK